MHRTPLMMSLSTSNHGYSQRWEQTLACMLVPLVVWFCVLASIQYGYYGNSRLVLGPSSSRLMKTSSILVEKVEVRNDHNNLVLYAFNQKPELISQTNWTTSRFLVVPRNTRKGFSLWLNKGSRIRMRWEAQASSRNQLEGMVIKGNEAEYMIEEDDRYQIGVLNMNDKNIVLNLNVNVSAKIYDTTKANNIYSSINGSCTFSLLFPNTYYLILTAPKNVDDDNDDSDGEWFVEVSFITRMVAYIAILGLCIIVIFMILRCLGGYDNDNDNSNVTIDTSNNNNNVLVSSSQEITEPMMHHHHDVKPNPKNDEEEESSEDGSSCSSEELYDEKLCVICYDEQRNCFFVPCGHSATCFPCAKRIVDGESKVCPVCRRLIHKVRRLFMS
ncbi:E3 ubiquitin-protein ligase APD1-like isoform X2 [Arachis duranensis]|uniref:E3 ubiquitin-protein ligase APD1-like isoform X2 n=1 Tax=Arachis duranensis TaxID=130453 RepID=A0A6P5M9W2_ARADU|nr:E3 ubiquitin-protein ligase APD1-like isoform X2 [Arachis duranensis]